MNADYPPTDEDGFLAFARSLSTPLLYEAIKNAEPLTAPYGYRQAENRMRYYETLPRYLENFLVTGDAIYAFNPVYGQGMTTATMVSETLDVCLNAHRHRMRHRMGEQTLTGLAQRFQKAAATVIAGPWQMATGQDARWPEMEGGDEPDPVTRLVQRYLDQVLNRMPDSTIVAEAFFQVQHMLKPPTSLFHPRVLWQVLKPQAQPASVTATAARDLAHAG
jgi:2-polyprenyl-6-methoxyphenol hydroxylase-like FAD-dependent oxidoreductase